MVSVTNLSPEMYEALKGKGRLTMNFNFRQDSATYKQCLRIYYEFLEKDETDY
jgi:hypothetical protein